MRPVQAGLMTLLAASSLPASAEPSVQNVGARSMTGTDVESWLDGLVPYALRTGDLAGAIVVVVKDGEVLATKGYGYADVAARRPVDPATTLFRLGSVSKLFTWTAVMQWVEEGKLDLDVDINRYLDFSIPARAGRAITLRDLMTHTAGFEERSKGLLRTTPETLRPLGEALQRWIPERVFAPGTTPAYSNYGTALAGYIVQRVSGMRFESYVDRHILAPLGMAHSTFMQPMPDSLQPFMSRGYGRASEGARPHEYVELIPAGAMVTTGPDIARFMIAHLQNGEYDGERILRPETARMMHETPLTIIPPLARMLLGFYEHDINGRRVIAHAGDSQWFHTEVNLYIDDGVGLFVSINSTGRDGAASALRTALFEGFSNRYLPGPAGDEPATVATAHAHGERIAGLYDNSRSSRSSFMALDDFLNQAEVTLNGDDTISVARSKGLDGKPKKWREIAPFLWQQVGGHHRLAAKIENGAVVRFGLEPVSPYSIYEPVKWWRSSAWLLPAVIVGAGALLVTVLLWPVGFLVRRYFGVPLALPASAARMRRLMRMSALAVLLTLGGWVLAFDVLRSSVDMMSARMDIGFASLHLLSLIVFVGAASLALCNLWCAWRGRSAWWSIAWSACLCMSCLAVLWLALVCHLIGVQLDY
jgi:CubicO group peptidase (beta-lactamase class C family)